MTPDHEALVEAQIDQAYEFAAQGADDIAAKTFASVRAMCVTLSQGPVLARRLENHEKILVREREEYRSILAERRTADRNVVVLADSLGLPRPEDKTGALLGADRTYPGMLLDRLPEHGVQSYCQRYFTTQHIVDLLAADPELGSDSDVVIHVGLNDCANRMFLERERIALNLLPDETKDKIVGFAQRYRRMLIRNLPHYHYVNPDEFRGNFEQIMRSLRQRGAGRIVLATIILPPVKFWQATPGLQENFANYNLMIMQSASRHGGLLFDVDRHVWGRQHEGVLLPDGMHLSEVGHQLFADEVAALLS